jgi:hypothetical protein
MERENNMANKAFYMKKLQNGNEFCLVVGYVGDQKACVFERNSVTFNEIQDTVQILSTQEAVKVYLSKY